MISLKCTFTKVGDMPKVEGIVMPYDGLRAAWVSRALQWLHLQCLTHFSQQRGNAYVVCRQKIRPWGSHEQ